MFWLKFAAFRVLLEPKVRKFILFRILPGILIVLGVYQLTIMTGTHREFRRFIIKGCDSLCHVLMIEEYKAEKKELTEKGRAADYDSVIKSLNRKLGRK